MGGSHRIATLATPKYLRGRDHPGVPADLHQHRCLNIRLADGFYRWEYSRNGRLHEIQPLSPMISNDSDTLMQAARAGAGVGCAFEAQVRAEINSGKLIALLEPWWPSISPFDFYYPRRTHIPVNHALL